MERLVKSLKSNVKTIRNARRDPRYIFVLIGSFFAFAVCTLQVLDAGLFDSLEKPLFDLVNSLPNYLYSPMYVITQFGGLGSLIILVPIMGYIVNRRAALLLLLTATSAWFIAKVAKVLIARGRPGDVLDNINLFAGETFSGYGYPSGHATLSAASAGYVYFQVAPKYRKYLILGAFLVGISRMYLGAHFPLDIVGGWSLGLIIASAMNLAFGSNTGGISAKQLKKFLIHKGLDVIEIKAADVDARGSRPVFIKTADRKKYFVKIFGKQEHAADWLFKIFRFFRYKNLQAEEPHISSRRNIEIEAFGMLWAKQAGVRVANVNNIYRYGNYWLTIQDKLDAKDMSQHGHLLQKSLVDAWRQVAKLHNARIAHRDLRAANIMIDKKGKAWIIDFGFAEISASNRRLMMDTAELLMSMSLVVGVDRTIRSAKVGIGTESIRKALPYLQTAVFSGATTKLLKSNKEVLAELKERIRMESDVEEVEEAQVLRINRRKVLNILLLAIFIYLVAPQVGDFKEAFQGTLITDTYWLIPLALVSLSTYVFTGIIYAALASVPIRIRDASVVQLGASFVSKIIPGGLGNTALNARFLKKAGLDVVETSSVITTQTVLGLVMFVLPLAVFLVLNGSSVSRLVEFNMKAIYIIIGLSAIFVTGLVIAFSTKLKEKVLNIVVSQIESVRDLAKPSRELAIAAASSLAVTFAYIFCLYASLKAVGVDVGVSEAVLAYASAVIARSAIPTPGGLGPIEAAMIAALLGFGINKGEAVSAVLVFRLATFWIPIPFSFMAYSYINKKRLV